MDLDGPQEFDLLVIGGGASAAAIARDAAGRGLAVCLIASGDLAEDYGAEALAPSADAARLVVLTALDAAELCAQIRTRTACLRLARRRAHWAARLKGPRGVQDITALQVVKANPDEAQDGEALQLDRGWNGSAPALLRAAEVLPAAARALAERALALLGAPGPGWTAAAPLPGGDIPGGDVATFLAQQARFFPWLPPATLYRMAHAYGTRLPRVLGDARSLADCGQHFGGGLYAAEVIHLIRHEFARCPEDVLCRRTALALTLTPEECDHLALWFARFRIDDQAISAAIQSASDR